MSGKRRTPPPPPSSGAKFNDMSDPGAEEDFDSVRGIKLGTVRSGSVDTGTGADGRPQGLSGQSKAR